MMLYVRRGMMGGMGTVFHLRESCAKAMGSAEANVYALRTHEDVDHWRKTFGIRKICLKCRKAARRGK